jgi:hypothetical protein
VDPTVGDREGEIGTDPSAVPRRDEDRTASEMQTGQQIRAGAVVLIIAISGGDQRTRIADDHSGTPEALGEQILVVTAKVRPTTAKRPEPRRRPLTGRNLTALPTSLGEDDRNAIVRQLLDQPSQLVPLGAHRASPTRDLPAGSGDDRRVRSKSAAGPPAVQ